MSEHNDLLQEEESRLVKENINNKTLIRFILEIHRYQHLYSRRLHEAHLHIPQ